MDDITESPVVEAAPPETSPAVRPTRTPAGGLTCALAGLQAGMLGGIAMLAWLSLDSSLDRRGFWSEENLFASLFYRGDAVRAGFGAKTMAGIALYLIVYSLLGALFAFALRNRFGTRRTVLSALVFALGWYYLSFHLLWKSAMPLVYLLYADRPMLVGHLIYGACLAAFPGCLPGRKPAQMTRETPAGEAAPAPEVPDETAGPVEPLPPSSE
jgi:hypothetical protein